MQSIVEILARELGRGEAQVANVVALIDEGNTIPFIARYRKELHGAMDDTALRTLADRLQYLRSLDKRRQEVKSSIEGQGQLTEELSAAIDAAATLAEVEDLYRPYKPKRRTRATMAREKGLSPLAELLFAQGRDCPDPLTAAEGYVDPEKGVNTAEEALQGASTSLPSSSRTTPLSARPCGSCGRTGGSWCPGRRRRSRRTASTGCTTTSGCRCAGPWATRCWPSTGGSGRKF